LTTLNKLEKALASAKGLSSDLKTFSMDTNDQQAKQMFTQLSSQMENISQMINSRVDYVKNESLNICRNLKVCHQVINKTR